MAVGARADRDLTLQALARAPARAGTSTGGIRDGTRLSEPVQAGRSALITTEAKMSLSPLRSIVSRSSSCVTRLSSTSRLRTRMSNAS